MKRYFYYLNVIRVALVLMVLVFSVSLANAQGPGPTAICFTTNGRNCIPVTSTNPFPVSASVSVTFPTIGAAVPATAVYNALNVAGTLRGWSGLGLGSIFAGTVAVVDASGNQITSFGSTTSNSPITPAAATATTSLVLGGQYNSTQATFTNGQQGSLQISSRGELKILNMDAAGNARGANVNASNELNVSPGATENHIGEVGGNILPITNTMTTSNATVTTGKSVGGLQTLSNVVRVSGSLGASGTSGIIQSVMLTFKDAIGSIPFDVYYFNANPSGSTCTDNTTFALVDADRDKVIFIAHVTDLTASNTAAIGQAGNMAIPFGISSSTTAYACVVTRGSAAITGTANASLITRILRN